MKKSIVLTIVVLIAVIPIIATSAHSINSYGWKTANEEFDSSLVLKIQNVSQLLNYVTKINKADSKTLSYAESLAETVRKRFYHSYSYYAFSENWSAYLISKLTHKDYSAIVIPDDILKHPMAACSQQSIVMMKCFERLHIPYRAVFFSNHYALEAFLENNWYFFDTDKEPDFPNGRKSLQQLLKDNEFYISYHRTNTIQEVKSWMGKTIRYSDINTDPAPHAYLFQQFTKFVSSYLFWAIALVLLFRISILRRKIAKQNK